jgi:hypothetical protein
MRVRGIVAAVAVLAVGTTSIALAAPVNVPNGGFEEGNFSNWERFERGGGDWSLYSVAPRGLGPGPIPPPPQGKTAALLTQGGPGVNILHRVLKLERNAVNKMKFKLFYDNSANRFFTPDHFRFGGGMGPPPPRGIVGGQSNQQLRVDLMKPKARIRSLNNDDILATLLWTKRNDPLRRPYRTVRANMKKLDVDARRVRLRIAEVDNRGEFFVGVDALKQTAR